MNMFKNSLPTHLQKFCTPCSVGKCVNPEIEFGNLHRHVIRCQYADDNNECYFCDYCERREGEVENEGWWTI